MKLRRILLTSTLLIAALSLESCDFSSAILKAASAPKLSFSSSNSDTHDSDSSHTSDNGLKPCGSVLAPGESCALVVQFTPATQGTRLDSLQIRSNGESLEEVALTGQGE
jgi:hypothetical protein